MNEIDRLYPVPNKQRLNRAYRFGVLCLYDLELSALGSFRLPSHLVDLAVRLKVVELSWCIMGGA